MRRQFSRCDAIVLATLFPLLGGLATAQDDEPKNVTLKSVVRESEDGSVSLMTAEPLVLSAKQSIDSGHQTLTPQQVLKILNNLPPEAREAFELARKQLSDRDRKQEDHKKTVGGIFIVQSGEKSDQKSPQIIRHQFPATVFENQLRDDVVRQLPAEVREKLEQAERQLKEVRQTIRQQAEQNSERSKQIAQQAVQQAQQARKNSKIATEARIVIVDPNGEKREFSFTEKNPEEKEGTDADIPLDAWIHSFVKRKPDTEAQETDNDIAQKLDLILDRLEKLETRVDQLSESQDD